MNKKTLIFNRISGLLFVAGLGLIVLLLASCGLDGKRGMPGAKGRIGDPGFDQVIEIVGSAPSCPNGGQTLLMALDVNHNGFIDVQDRHMHSTEICNGNNGANGSNGSNGQDGSNGTNGQDGAPGQSVGMTLVSVIDPCGDSAGVYDEVLLQLSDGRILASFSDNAAGQNTRFSIIGAGSYVTTDGSSCHFSIDQDNNVTF